MRGPERLLVPEFRSALKRKKEGANIEAGADPQKISHAHFSLSRMGELLAAHSAQLIGSKPTAGDLSESLSDMEIVIAIASQGEIVVPWK